MFSTHVVSKVTYTDIFMILIKPIGGRLWYIYVLIEYYLLFSYDAIKKNIGKWWVLIIVLLISISNIFISSDCWFSLKRATRDILPFYTGILLCNPERKKIFNTKAFIIASILIVFVRMYLYIGGFFSNTIPVLSVLYGTVVSVWIFTVFERIEWFSNISILRSVGIQTMEMYLFHEYPLTVGTIIFPSVIPNAWLSILVCMIFTVSSVMIVSVILRLLHLNEILFKPYKSFVLRKDS
jgi:hypothetical protein